MQKLPRQAVQWRFSAGYWHFLILLEEDSGRPSFHQPLGIPPMGLSNNDHHLKSTRDELHHGLAPFSVPCHLLDIVSTAKTTSQPSPTFPTYHQLTSGAAMYFVQANTDECEHNVCCVPVKCIIVATIFQSQPTIARKENAKYLALLQHSGTHLSESYSHSHLTVVFGVPLVLTGPI